MLTDLVMGFLFVSMIVLYATAIAVVKMWIELKSMQKSTHTIQYVDPLEKFKPLTEDEKKVLQKDFFADNI